MLLTNLILIVSDIYVEICSVEKISCICINSHSTSISSQSVSCSWSQEPEEAAEFIYLFLISNNSVNSILIHGKIILTIVFNLYHIQ